jgi:hypothetical protein
MSKILHMLLHFEHINMFIINFIIIISFIVVTGVVTRYLKSYRKSRKGTNNRMTFEDYSKEVNLNEKCKKVRGSDVNLLKYIYSCLPSGSDYLYGGKMTITEKMDGTQVWFRLDDRSIGDLRTHNGFSIGNNVVFTQDDVFSNSDTPVMYQKINIGEYFHLNFNNFMRLFKNLKMIEPNMKYCYVFMEVMLPISPCKIEYPEAMNCKNYIFHINTSSGNSIRVNNRTSPIISSANLFHVPIIGEYSFTEKGVRDMCNWIKSVDREGAIIEIETSSSSGLKTQCFKVKNGAHDTSSFAARFVPKIYHGTKLHTIIDELISLANHNVDSNTLDKRSKGMQKNTKGDYGANELVMLLMEKEITHNDWVSTFSTLTGKEYQNMINDFTANIEEKLHIEDPNILKNNYYKKIIKKQLVPKLKRMSVPIST